MDQTNANPFAELAVSLTQMAVSGTVTAVNTKIKTIQSEKDAEKIKNSYSEIVNELICEREEAIRIAQVYKAEYERIAISDQDIEHLHATVARILDLLSSFSPGMDMSKLQAVKDLISVDTLKTMQLLGFNYKAAIGEPLTQICANAINNWGNKGNKTSVTKGKK